MKIVHQNPDGSIKIENSFVGDSTVIEVIAEHSEKAYNARVIGELAWIERRDWLDELRYRLRNSDCYLELRIVRGKP